MKVEVRPLPNEKWHGKKGQESFTRPKKYTPLVDADNMTYATGLTSEEEEKYGKELNQDLTANYNPEHPHSFWDGPMAVIKLDNSTMFFETNKTLAFIKVKNMKASKYIANSIREWNEGDWPEATHVIFDEDEDVEEKASKVSAKHKAIVEEGKLSQSRKLQIVLILSGKDLKGQSSDFIKVAMNDLIENDPLEVLRYIQQDKKQISNQALVIEALQKNILRKVGHKIMYHDSVLGGDELDVALYLMEDENNEFKIRLMKAVSE